MNKDKLNWRLPDKEELVLMYENLHKKDIGGFADDYYWSSSEGFSSNAWYQSFYFGYQNIYYKISFIRVRAVRFFNSNEDFEIGQETATGYVFAILGNTVFECKKEDEPKEMDWHEAMRTFGA